LGLAAFSVIAVVTPDRARAGGPFGGGFGGWVNERVNQAGKGLAEVDQTRLNGMHNPATYQTAGAVGGAIVGGPTGAMVGYQGGTIVGTSVPQRGGPQPAGGYPPQPSYPGPQYPQGGYPPQGGGGSGATDWAAAQRYADRQHQQELDAIRLRASLQAKEDAAQYQRQQQLNSQQAQQQQWQARQQQQSQLMQGIFSTVGGVVQSAQGRPGYSYGP
jgi:hypothetical protein